MKTIKIGENKKPDRQIACKTHNLPILKKYPNIIILQLCIYFFKSLNTSTLLPGFLGSLSFVHFHKIISFLELSQSFRKYIYSMEKIYHLFAREMGVL